MIRLGKPVQILEWGQGTNTTNQKWVEMGTGKIVSRPKTVDGVTTIVVELDKSATKQNIADDALKIAQQGEGMTPNEATKWGEVAFGRLKDLNGNKVEIEVKVACKY